MCVLMQYRYAFLVKISIPVNLNEYRHNMAGTMQAALFISTKA